jgi:hypothetical protein
VELATVVRRDGADPVGFFAQQGDGSMIVCILRHVSDPACAADAFAEFLAAMRLLRSVLHAGCGVCAS